MTPSKYNSFSKTGKNNERIIANISVTMSDTNAETLPAIPASSKKFFLDHQTPLRKVIHLEVKNISRNSKLNSYIHLKISCLLHHMIKAI